MANKTETQAALETAREALKQAQQVVKNLKEQRKSEVLNAKKVREAAKAERAAKREQRQAVFDLKRADRLWRLEAMVEKMKATENVNKGAKARHSAGPSAVTIIKPE